MHSWWKAGISGFEQRQNFKAIYIGREKLSVERKLVKFSLRCFNNLYFGLKATFYYNRTATF